MYKVLIVDDESFVIKSLIASIDWDHYGFEIAGQAGSGQEALEAIRGIKPDLVFTDVQMPGMNGLELIKNASERYPNVLFVVISGYAEFAYAQRAMNYGALGYCLKPFEDSEIIGMLGKAASKLDQSKAALELKLMEHLEDKSPSGTEIVRHALEALDVIGPENDGILVMVSIGGALRLSDPAIKANLRIGNSKNAFLADYRHADRLRDQLTRSFPESVKGIGFYASKVGLNSIRQAIEESMTAAGQFFVTGRRGVYDTGVLNSDDANRQLQQLDQAIDGKDTDLVRHVLELVDRSRERFDIRHAMRIYNMVMSYRYRSDTVKYEDYVYSIEQLTSLFGDFGHLLAELRQLLVRPSGPETASSAKGTRNVTFQGVLLYVNEHYSRNISIQDISEQFNINPNYVSQLFKKNLDITFTEYVARKRIAYAGDLLRTTNLPVNEIAHRAGYDEYYYFTRVFKKMTGKTPTEYRQEYG